MLLLDYWLLNELWERRRTAVIINISIVNTHKQQVHFPLIIQKSSEKLFEVNIQWKAVSSGGGGRQP